MIRAFHTIFTAFGFWLPNDPSGSWSDFVASWELLLTGGKATKTRERQSTAHIEHDEEARRRAKESLKHQPVEFTGSQAKAIARGFETAIHDGGYRLFACSILPEHVHMVIQRHERDIERIVGHLKSAATRALDVAGLHPFADCVKRNGTRQSPWAERCWKVFLNDVEDVRRSMEYVEENPVKEGKKLQRWGFVVPYE